MTPAQVQVAIDLMQARGISQSDAMQVLALTAESLMKSERIAKATRLGITLAELDSRETGKSIGAALNQRFGWGAK